MTHPSRFPQTQTGPMAIQKWGGLASFVLAAVLIVPEAVYLMGNLRDANGPLAYSVADFLYGPVRAAALVTAVYALRQRMGERAPRRMSLATLSAALAAGMFVLAALLRASNRHYHLIHPELHLENDSTVLIVWTTLVAGVIAAGWHFLGWSLVLLGTAGWTTGRLPQGLSVLYCVVGAASLFVYLQPELEGFAVLFGGVMSIWQGIVLWRAGPEETSAPRLNAGQPDFA